jgi:hypothetical protein
LTTSVNVLLTSSFVLVSWTGVIYLASDRQGLKTFVDALRLPHPELHVRANAHSVFFVLFVH